MTHIWERKEFRFAAGILITGPVLWLCFRKLDWDVLWASFSRVRWIWVGAALINVVFSVYALGWRWRILLKPKAKISMRRLFHLNIIGQYTNIISPARVGEVVRGYLAAKDDNLPGGYAIGTIFYEKILDFSVFLALWMGVPAAFMLEISIRGYIPALIAACLIIGILIFLILKPQLVLLLYGKLSFLFPGKYRKRLQEFFSSGLEFFQQLKDWKTNMVLVALTVVFLGGNALTIFFLFRAFGLKLSFYAAVVVLLVIQVANIPPSLPGKIGVFEYAVILALTVFSIEKGAALSYGILLHVVAYVPKIVIGQYLIARYKIRTS
ncbi:lysylphosphatidylglycerol synthase transmembrane domain-containing protein [Acidobacteriota bacterium]